MQLIRLLTGVLMLGAAAGAAPPGRDNVQLAEGWRFQMDPDDIGAGERWYAADFDRSAWGQVPVPRAWDLYDEALWGYEGIGWYTVSVPGSLARSGKLQRLKFGRVNYYTRAWLNGEPLGENVGGYLPFEFDVTGKLRSDAPNALVLRVDNKPRLEWLPAAKDIEWIQYGGLLAPVSLETTSTLRIADLAIRAVPQGAGAAVACAVVVHNADAAARGVVLRIGISGGPSRSIPLELAPASTSVHDISLAMVQAARWSPQSPALYTLNATIESDGRALDGVAERFGVRRIEARGREILLNGERVRVRGVNRYDEYGRYGPNAPRDLVVEDVKQMKKAGVNFIRVHYPQSPDLLSLYDEMGFLMVEELPLNWWGNGFSGKDNEIQSESILTQAMPTLERMIRRDKNHPCLIIWSMANESKTDNEVGINVMRKLMRRTKELDPSRLVTFVSHGADMSLHKAYADADLVAFNMYYGVFSEKVALHQGQFQELVRKPSEEHIRRQLSAYPDKPMLVTEFGNRGIRGIHGDVHYSEDFQAAYIQTVWKVIESFDALSGGVLWSWADYYHRRNFIFYAPFGPYGAVTVDRRPKAALRALTEMYGGK